MKTAGGMPREGPGIAWHSSADSGPKPVLCILPPHVLKNLYSNGSDVQKQIALASIVGSARLRGRRASAPHVAAMRGAAESGGKRRRVFTADNTSTLPGRLLRAEGQPASTDAAANEAYDGAGLTYDLYWDVSPSMDSGCSWTQACITEPSTTMRSGTGNRWCTEMAMVSFLTASRWRSM